MFMLLLRLPVHGRPLGVTFWGDPKVVRRLLMALGGSAPLIPEWFKSQLDLTAVVLSLRREHNRVVIGYAVMNRLTQSRGSEPPCPRKPYREASWVGFPRNCWGNLLKRVCLGQLERAGRKGVEQGRAGQKQREVGVSA